MDLEFIKSKDGTSLFRVPVSEILESIQPASTSERVI